MTVQFAFPTAPFVTSHVRDSLLEKLAVLRKEWEAAAEGDSLVDVSASVGLMLLDIATQLGLTPEERVLFLGARLDQEAIASLQDSQD